MDDDSSNDVQAVEIDSDSDNVEEKPLMLLFKRLIGNDNKQKLVLTNSQIMAILNKEFNINTRTLHELEIDIYLSVMKKFLKDWPQWDEFDRNIHRLLKKNDKSKIKALLLRKYRHLINYLRVMLEEAKPKAREAVENLEGSEETVSDVIMEVHCNRAQLNGLFLKHPHPEQNYTVFNVEVSRPSTISLDTPDYTSIINWFNVSIIFGCRSFYYTRASKHELKHILVNKKLNIKKNEIKKVNCTFQEKCTSYSRKCDKSTVLNVIHSLKAVYKTELMDALINMIKEDIRDLPDQLNIPATYQKYITTYPYVRYLYTEVPEAQDDLTWAQYDLQLEELVYPKCRFYIGKVNPDVFPKFTDNNQIIMECKDCSCTFSGSIMLEELHQHIMSVHLNEPDWHCTKCNKAFSMVLLTKNRWTHECEE